MYFYWKCKLCKDPIETDIVTVSEHGKDVRYHRKCYDNIKKWDEEADKILNKARFKH